MAGCRSSRECVALIVTELAPQVSQLVDQAIALERLLDRRSSAISPVLGIVGLTTCRRAEAYASTMVCACRVQTA